MNTLILISLIFVGLLAFSLASNSISAIFDSETGATGYFQIRYAEGSAIYFYDIDFSNFQTTCDIKSGLKCNYIIIS